MIKTLFKASLVAMSILLTLNLFSQSNDYLDTNLPVDQRVDDLISKMTLQEKIAQLGHKPPAISRLKVEGYNYWNEAIHGVARSGKATSFPVSIALSSTWDTDLMFRVATAISDEARIYNNTKNKGLTYWSPTINLARDPRWGRSEENYGEDVHLTEEMAISFIKGMQGDDPKYLKTIATAKHYAANNVEANRYGISSNVDERSLREYYLPAFEACVKEAGVYSVMSAYNAVNGVPSPANQTLLNKILRDEWGFDGYVVSDCDAVYNVNNDHKYTNSFGEAVALSILSGNDLNCGTTFPDYAQDALDNGAITEADIDIALKRIFKARFLLGEFDPADMVPYRSISAEKLDSEEHRKLALEAAHKAIVLLKNDNAFLPLDKSAINKIAVVGPNANAVQLGGYSGTPTVSVSVLQGIADALGVDISDGTIEAENFSDQSGIQTESSDDGGSNVGYIHNGDFTAYEGVDFGDGRSKMDIRVASDTDGGQVEVRLDNASGQLLGKFEVTNTGGWQNWTTLSADIAKTTGVHTVYLKFTGGSGFLFNINWLKIYNEGDVDPTSGEGVIGYTQGCSIDGSKDQAEFDKAVALAQNADVAVVVLGTDLGIADESHDRSNLKLPGVQEQLLQAVYAANPNTVVVLVNGVQLAVNWAQENVPAMMSAWYNGQAQGTAISDVIFGEYNPGGKLTSTWYQSIRDLPSMHDYDVKNNRTYMYFEGTPLYAFGHGLSYTDFEYSNITVTETTTDKGRPAYTVSADIKNSGQVAGDEVVQLYVHTQSEMKRPVKQLQGFERVTLNPGETKNVSLTLIKDQLKYYDEESRTYKVESGKVDIYLGSASDDIRLSGEITVEGEEIATTYRHDPFSVMQAEQFEKKSKYASVGAGAQSSLSASFDRDGDYIMFKNMDFAQGADSLILQVSATKEGELEIVLDEKENAPVGKVSIPVSQSFTELSSNQFRTVNGLHDVFFVWRGEQGSDFKLDWFSFRNAEGVILDVAKDQFECIVHPNPGDSNIMLSYHLPVRSNVKIEIFDIQGTKVNSYRLGKQSPGSHTKPINLANDLQAGIYIARIYAGDHTKAIKFVVR